MSFELELRGPIAEVVYLAGRAVAGCPTFIQRTGQPSAEECFANAVVFGEWNPVVPQMPKAVIVNQDILSRSNLEAQGDFTSTGTVTAIIYLPADYNIPNESFRELDAYSFLGSIIEELFEQSTALNSEGSQFAGKTLFLTEINVIGPTRTMEADRGPNGENDYFDCVLMMQWGVQ